MPQPPLLPEIVLGRVLRVARLDGGGTLLLGGLFALLMAAMKNFPFAAVGLVAAGAGAVELHGVALLRHGDARGMRWLIGSQPLLLLAIWSYCALRLMPAGFPPIPETMQPFLDASAAQWGMSTEAYVRMLHRLTVGALASAALGLQGGLAIYYLRRRAAVERALGKPFRFGEGTTNGHE